MVGVVRRYADAQKLTILKSDEEIKNILILIIENAHGDIGAINKEIESLSESLVGEGE